MVTMYKTQQKVWDGLTDRQRDRQTDRQTDIRLQHFQKHAMQTLHICWCRFGADWIIFMQQILDFLEVNDGWIDQTPSICFGSQICNWATSLPNFEKIGEEFSVLELSQKTIKLSIVYN